MNHPTLDLDVEPSEFDALADLFLSDAPAPDTTPAATPVKPPPRAERSAAVTIEGVIAGHLPVLASAWVTQYARSQADLHQQPIGLLRLQGGHVTVDVVMPTGGRAPADLAARTSEPITTILTRAAATCRRWLVRVDELAEGDLLSQASINSVAMLTGADDPAVLASYQTIKGLAHESQSEADAPTLRLVIMGAQDAKADAAESRLRRAAATFLSRTIEPALRIGKIGSALSVHVCRVACTMELNDLITAIRSVPAAAPAPVAAVAAPVLVMPPETNGHAHRPSQPCASSRIGSVAVTARHTERLGLKVLPINCPYAQAVDFAAGVDAKLHIVATTDHEVSLAEASKRLLSAAAWANDHAQLISLACPGMKASESVLHLITLEAKPARPLLDTGIKLHLLSRVECGGQTAFAVCELN